MTITEITLAANNYLLHFLTSIVLTLLFAAFYLWITPYPELKLIKEGKIAPAISFSGALLGFVLPMASAIANSVSFWDMLVWAVFALFVQIAVFFAVRKSIKDIGNRIENDQIASAILLGVLSLAVGVLNAASMIY